MCYIGIFLETTARIQSNKVKSYPPISIRRMSHIIEFSGIVSNLTAFLETGDAVPTLNNPTLVDE